MLHAAYLMPLLPLGGFVVLALFGRRLGDPWAGWLGTVAVGASFVVACVVYAGVLGLHSPGRVFEQHLFDWIDAGPLQVQASLRIDPLSMTMALFITGISTLINLYSIGYMKGDADFPKFFLYLNLFVASMLILVLGGNLLFTFVGWEGVGACSYWLVAFWFERPSAASAGKKAFIYNRVGDVGFLLAMFLIFQKTGTLEYAGIFSHLGDFNSFTATAAILLLFLAAAGKSAQFPLFPWLADAMEGPTPVSALIHAATMVTAGVYLLCRMNPLIAISHAGVVIAVIGAATAFIAATIACAQQDIKKVLAYSTISQLGYMFLAVGSGAYVAAIFLMVAHAFFKGLLFLGAGSVIHGMHDEQDLKKMGGLRRVMLYTYGTFLVGWLAIAGFPPLSGFWAKSDILANAWNRYPVLYFVGALTAFLTAYYMSRLFALAFLGDERWRKAVDTRGGHAAEPHESSWIMLAPLFVLAFLAFFGGLLDLPWAHGPLQWLDVVIGPHTHLPSESAGLKVVLAVVDGILAIGGIVVALRVWRRIDHPELEPAALRRSWYLDDIYDTVIGRPGAALAQAAAVFDKKVIDGAVEGIAVVVRQAGSGLRRIQTGFVRQYALGIMVGMVALLAFMFTRAWR